MEYILQGSDVELKLSSIKVYKDSLDFSNNTLLNTQAKSGKFSGFAEMEIDIRMLGVFSINLKNMYESLLGEALLKETYGGSYIRMKSTGKGHFELSCYLHQAYPHHKLEVETQIDQTMLKAFSKQLYKDFSKYADL